ncbi:unnamed protein product [Effrenium voratum]|nr:unnamed protein product [Effrenium voratum]
MTGDCLTPASYPQAMCIPCHSCPDAVAKSKLEKETPSSYQRHLREQGAPLLPTRLRWHSASRVMVQCDTTVSVSLRPQVRWLQTSFGRARSGSLALTLIQDIMTFKTGPGKEGLVW